jgi:hypothetical protein
MRHRARRAMRSSSAGSTHLASRSLLGDMPSGAGESGIRSSIAASWRDWRQKESRPREGEGGEITNETGSGR